nr:nucleotide-binding alpha-beta plait domain-containing protein [Tanacetum cinerariifolium]
MKDKATSFFFTNFPDSWDSAALWKMFDIYGKVVDVYIAFKRTKRNTRVVGARIPAAYSFKDAAAGPAPNVRNIMIDEDKNIRSVLECCWMGKAKNLQVLQNVCMEENKILLEQWFDNIKPWEEDNDTVGRLTWVSIEGLLTLGRNISAIKSIVKDFGSILEIRKLDFNSKLLMPIEILKLVPSMMEIRQSILVTLNSKSYPIRVFKEHCLASSLLSLSSGKDDDSVFYEEFVGFSMAEDGRDEGVNGGDDFNGGASSVATDAWGNVKSHSCLSPASYEVDYHNELHRNVYSTHSLCKGVITSFKVDSQDFNCSPLSSGLPPSLLRIIYSAQSSLVLIVLGLC